MADLGVPIFDPNEGDVVNFDLGLNRIPTNQGDISINENGDVLINTGDDSRQVVIPNPNPLLPVEALRFGRYNDKHINLKLLRDTIKQILVNSYEVDPVLCPVCLKSIYLVMSLNLDMGREQNSIVVSFTCHFACCSEIDKSDIGSERFSYKSHIIKGASIGLPDYNYYVVTEKDCYRYTQYYSQMLLQSNHRDAIIKSIVDRLRASQLDMMTRADVILNAPPFYRLEDNDQFN